MKYFVFDLGGVLSVPMMTKKLYDEIKWNIPFEKFQEIFNESEESLKAHKGEITTAEFLSYLSIYMDENITLEKFKEIVNYQGGNIDNIVTAQNIIPVKAPKSGYVKSISALKIGELARRLGAGRLAKGDEIDPTVGIVLTKKVGDEVTEGEVIAKIYSNKTLIPEKDVSECFEITDLKVNKSQLIYEIIK